MIGGGVLLGRAKPQADWMPATVTSYTLGSALTVTIDGASTAVKATLGWNPVPALAVNDRVWCVKVGGKLLVVARQEFYGSTVTIPSAATSVVGPDSFGHAASVGTSSAWARGDHDHGLPGPGGMVLKEEIYAGTGPIGIATGPVTNHLEGTETFTKLRSDTQLNVYFSGTNYVSAVGVIQQVVQAGTSGWQILAQYYFNATADHRTYGGQSVIAASNVATTGSVTVSFGVTVPAGMALQGDANDYWTLKIAEVIPG